MTKFDDDCRFVICPNARYLVCQLHLEKHIDTWTDFTSESPNIKLCDSNYKLCYSRCCLYKYCENPACLNNNGKCADRFIEEYDKSGWDVATYCGRDCLYCALRVPQKPDDCCTLQSLVSLAMWEVENNIPEFQDYLRSRHDPFDNLDTYRSIYSLTYNEFDKMNQKYNKLNYSPDPGPGYLESKQNWTKVCQLEVAPK